MNGKINTEVTTSWEDRDPLVEILTEAKFFELEARRMDERTSARHKKCKEETKGYGDNGKFVWGYI